MNGAKHPATSRRRIRAAWLGAAFWTAYFFAWVAGLIIAGAVLGAIAFPIGGQFFETGKTSAQLALSGARFLSFIFMIWAPAVALVACVMKAWKRNAARTDA